MNEQLGRPEKRKLDLLELQNLAMTLPKTERSEPGSIHDQFRETFFKRFPEMSAVTAEQATDDEVFYVRMVKERFGYDLLDFYARNRALCDTICEAVAAKEPYDQLVTGYYEVLECEGNGGLPAGSAQSLHEATGHPLGIEAIGIHFWDQLNPLLEHAYGIIDAQTINAPFLGR